MFSIKKYNTLFLFMLLVAFTSCENGKKAQKKTKQIDQTEILDLQIPIFNGDSLSLMWQRKRF